MCSLGVAVSKGDSAGVACVWVRVEDVAAGFSRHDEGLDESTARVRSSVCSECNCLRTMQIAMSKESNAWARVILGVTVLSRLVVNALCGTSQVGSVPFATRRNDAKAFLHHLAPPRTTLQIPSHASRG